MIPVQKIDDMGEHRGRDIMKKTRQSLTDIAGEMPDDIRDADAVIIPGIGFQITVKREGGILQPAVHSHIF